MNKNIARNGKQGWKKIVIYLALFVGLTITTIIALFPADLFFADFHDLPSMFRSPPSDEEMIANFYRHQKDFDRLARIYREDTSVPTVMRVLVPTPEIAAMMSRISVATIKGDDETWIPPDPYSKDPDFLEQKVKSEICRDAPGARKFSGVIFYSTHGRVTRRHYGQPIYKQYYYVPIAPRVEDGVLVLPGTSTWSDHRVLETLNRYPPGFATFNCVYRQIEPQWFIRMCQDKQ